VTGPAKPDDARCSKKRTGLRLALLAVVFLLLSIVFTRDVILFIASGTPYGAGDSVMFSWNFWWVAEQLKDGELFFKCHWAMLPFGIRTIYHTLIPLHCVVLAPITWLFGPLVSSNLHLILSFAVGALGMGLLVRSLTGSYTAGLCAGIVFGFSTTHWYHSFGPYNLTATELLPFCLLFLLKWVRTQKPVTLVVASGLLALNLYNGYTSTIVLGLCAVPIFVLGVVRTLKIHGLKRLIIGIVPAAILSTVVALPIVHYAAEFSSLFDADWGKDYFVAELSSPDLLSYFLPDKNVWFSGPFLKSRAVEAFVGRGYDCPQFFGIVALVLACIGVNALYRKDRPLLLCLLIGAVICAAVSLGPEPKVCGLRFIATEFSPFDILASLPYMNTLRGPGRFGLGVVLLGAILVGLGAAKLLSKPRSTEAATILTVLIAGLLFAERVHVPMWTKPLTVPGIYRKIPELQPRPRGIIITPFHIWSGHRKVGEFPLFDPAAILYYQTKHITPMMNGHSSRIPREIESYYRQAPLTSSLMALQTGRDIDAAQILAEKDYVERITYLLGVSHIVCDYRAKYFGLGVPMRRYIEEVLHGKMVYGDDTGRIYELPFPDAAARELTITPDDASARLYLMEGWHKPVMHEGRKRFVFDPSRPTDETTCSRRIRVIFRTSEATDTLRYSYQFSPVFPERFEQARFRIDLDGKTIGEIEPIASKRLSIRGVIESDIEPGLHYLTLTPCADGFSEARSHPPGLSRRAVFIEKIQLEW